MIVKIMAGLGWLMLLAAFVYTLIQAFNMTRLSVCFTGKINGECVVVFVVSVIIGIITWYTFPFNLSISLSLP